MMSLSQKKIVILLVSSLFFSFSMGMMMYSDDGDNMSSCPFMDMDVVCQMGLFEHLGVFQNMFIGTPVKSIFFVIIFLIILVTLALVPEINAPPNKRRFFVEENLRLPNFNRIISALADGIIQPKLYA